MPMLGEIRKGSEISKKAIYSKFVWAACSICGKERWVRIKLSNPVYNNCTRCKAQNRNYPIREDSWAWRGGRYEDDGYVSINVKDRPEFASMLRHNGYVFEHRLIMAEHLGRALTSDEMVHHINGVRHDNRIENLCLTNAREHDVHALLHRAQKRIQELEDKIREMEEEET